jgi:hypothetical protein
VIASRIGWSSALRFAGWEIVSRRMPSPGSSMRSSPAMRRSLPGWPRQDRLRNCAPGRHDRAARLASLGSFNRPVSVTAPPDDARRAFVVQRRGAIRIGKGGGSVVRRKLAVALW